MKETFDVSSKSSVERDVIVVGASAGGVPALQSLAGSLAPDFRGTILVVLHIPPWAASELPAILAKSGPLPATHAAPSQPLEPGRIYVAPPDFHMVVEDHRVLRWRGPTEDRHRPSINTLFRSAAVAHRERVVGVILSGALDDGSTGLWWVKRFGGIAIVQNPNEAEFPDMPRSALEHVDIDYVLGASEIGGLLNQLANGASAADLAPLRAKGAEERLKWKRR